MELRNDAMQGHANRSGHPLPHPPHPQQIWSSPPPSPTPPPTGLVTPSLTHPTPNRSGHPLPHPSHPTPQGLTASSWYRYMQEKMSIARKIRDYNRKITPVHHMHIKSSVRHFYLCIIVLFTAHPCIPPSPCCTERRY